MYTINNGDTQTIVCLQYTNNTHPDKSIEFWKILTNLNWPNSKAITKLLLNMKQQFKTIKNVHFNGPDHTLHDMQTLALEKA